MIFIVILIFTLAFAQDAMSVVATAVTSECLQGCAGSYGKAIKSSIPFGVPPSH